MLCNTRRMPRAALPTGIEIEYETYGDPEDPALLLVNGYTSQMLSWNVDLVGQFVQQGLFVIRFDNRDVGLSSKLDGRRSARWRSSRRPWQESRFI